MPHRTRLASCLICMAVLARIALTGGMPASAQSHTLDDTLGDERAIYRGTLTLKQQPELGCNYTGDPAGGEVLFTLQGATAAAHIEGQDEGVRQALNCPTGWSGDLKWKASYRGNAWGSFDGGGTVDEITMNGPMWYQFEYEYINCSSSGQDVQCPDKRVETDLIPITIYGKFADPEQTRVTGGSVIDEFNQRWGFWGVEIERYPVVASLRQLVPQVLVNGTAVDVTELRANDELTLRQLQNNGPLPKARVTCTVGEASGQSIDYEYVGSAILLNLVNPGGWDFSPQIVADWESVCSLAPAPEAALDSRSFVQILTSGAVMISNQNPALSQTIETPPVSVLTTGANTFVLAYSPDTEATLIAAFSGPLELLPSGDGLEPVRLESGEMRVVTADEVGAVMNLAQTFLPIVLTE